MRKGIYKAAALILAGTMCAGLTAVSYTHLMPKAGRAWKICMTA